MSIHTAQITCGDCGYQITIALGMASAIACGGCGTEITLGEEEIGTTPGGHCRCGNALPDVCDDETPYEFCGEECASPLTASITKHIEEERDPEWSLETHRVQHDIDKGNIGTERYQGIAWFHSREYRHILRSPGDYADAKGLKRAPSTRQWAAKYKRIHDTLMAAGLDVSGDSDAHDEIVYGILGCR